MNQFSHLHLNSGIKVEVIERDKDIDQGVRKEVDRIWSEESKNKEKTLFNEKILSMIKFDGKTMTSEYVDYKYAIAQLINPDLSKKIKIQPVGITAITVANNHFLIGKRSCRVAVYPGKYEFAPAGTISPHVLKGAEVDLKRQLLIELREEVGIDPTQVIEAIPTLLIKDPKLGYVEVCYRIEVEPSAMSLTSFSKEEYEEMMWLGLKDLKTFIHKHRQECVPVCVYLFNQIS